MRSFFGISILWTTVAIAQPVPLTNNSDNYKSIEPPKAAAPVYNVPINQPNTDTLLGSKPNMRFYARTVKCDGEEFTLIYIQTSGRTPGTTYLNLCNPRSQVDCTQDNSEKTVNCRTRAAKHFQAGRANTPSNGTPNPETLDQFSTPSSR